MFKTSWMQVALSLYGSKYAARDELLIKWGEGATNNAIMALLTHACDLPLLIDNFKPNTGGGSRALIGLLHNALEGGNKDRLDNNSELRESKPVFAWPVITGEDIPDTDPASLARVLLVRFGHQPENASALLSQAQNGAGELNAVGRSWIKYLESAQGRDLISKNRSKLNQLRGYYIDRLQNVNPDTVNARRIATNLATNHLTHEALLQHPDISTVVSAYEEHYMAGIEEIIVGMANLTTESVPAMQFLGALRELVGTGVYVLPGCDGREPVADYDRDRIIGYRDVDGSILLLPRLARKAVDQLLGRDGLGNVTPHALHKQLDEMGFVASRGADGIVKTARVGRDREVQRVLHLTGEALGDTSQE